VPANSPRKQNQSWNPGDKPPRPRRKRGDLEPVGSLLGAVIKDLGLNTRGKSRVEQLRPAWEEALGRQLAEQTKLLGLRKGVLNVEVQSAALGQEIEVYYQAAILKHFRSAVQIPVTRIRCRVQGSNPETG